jgi:hypothetical protein
MVGLYVQQLTTMKLNMDIERDSGEAGEDEAKNKKE